MMRRALLAGFALTPLLTAAGTSANYSLHMATLDGGGGKGLSLTCEINFSMGAGESGASANDRLRTGFAGRLRDALLLEIDRSGAPWSFNEQTSRQLVVNLLFDDDTLEPLSPTEVAWTLLEGPIAEVSADGVARAAYVYENTTAALLATYAGTSGTRSFTILNNGNDDFGSYAGDGLSDLWQVSYFGENNAQAKPGIDADNDGLNNLQEFAFATNPESPDSGPVQWSGSLLQQRGSPVPYVSRSSAFVFRAVFSRRKDHLAAGITYSVEFSGDLVTWQTSGSTPSVLAQDEVAEVVSVPYPFFVNGKKARFFRVRVEIL